MGNDVRISGKRSNTLHKASVGGRLTAATDKTNPARATPDAVARETFSTSRRLEFLSVSELEKQSGYTVDRWPEVIIKELVDNALDACEEARLDPEIEVEIDDDRIAVTDNGPGMPAATVAGIVNLDERVSSRQAYMAPDRGAQGNATKVLVGMPFALRPDSPGKLVIEAHGLRHEIAVTVDGLSEEPVVSLQTGPGVVKTGTRVEVQLPCSLNEDDSPFLQVGDGESLIRRVWSLLAAYGTFNPHLQLFVRFGDEKRRSDPSVLGWHKWRPCDATSVHWYDRDKFAALLKRCIAADMAAGKDRPVSQFVSMFDGMSGSAVKRDVLASCGLSRTSLSALAPDGEPDDDLIERLRLAMQSRAKVIPAKRLGLIGKEHLQQVAELVGADPATIRYAKLLHDDDDHPGVTEILFAAPRDGSDRFTLYGVNWSAALRNPFRVRGVAGFDSSLDQLLAMRYAGDESPVVLFVHHAQVGASYTDRGKGSLSLPPSMSAGIHDTINKLTERWVKQCKAEERNASAAARRADAMRQHRKPQVTIKDIAHEIMPAVYAELSDDGNGGRLPVNARQFMYRARPLILERTGKDRFGDAYFTQTLLPDYIADNPDTTADWDVVYDDRGHFTEPHTKRVVNLGTIDVRQYLSGCGKKHPFMPSIAVTEVGRHPTQGPINRFGAVLFIEKEGFSPLLQRVQLAERFDLAIMSTKGLSNVAARRLVDDVCGACSEGGLPLFVLHDFDKAGFSILGTLKNSSRRYTYRNAVNVIDLGVRLEDVRQWNLQSEPVSYTRGMGGARDNADPRDNLRDNGATEDEINFLVSEPKPVYLHGRRRMEYSGQRVELNAFSPRDFVAWIEGKLTDHGVKKVLPDIDTLETQYRCAMARSELMKQVNKLTKNLHLESSKRPVPATLRHDVEQFLKEHPTFSWDLAVLMVAGNQRRRGAL